MLALTTALHALAAMVWVGGMFFAHMALRPAVGAMPPPERVALWGRVFPRFFAWVWASIAVLLATGYWIVFGAWGGMAGAGMHVHVMQGLGILMMLLFVHLWFAPYGRFRRALAAGDISTAGGQIGQIRLIVTINLVLGITTMLVGASGRYWS